MKIKLIALCSISITAISLIGSKVSSLEAVQEWDRQIHSSSAAFDRRDWNAFCQHMGNQKLLFPFVRGNGSPDWDKTIETINKNIRNCKDNGLSTVSTIKISEINTPIVSTPKQLNNEELLENAKSIGIDMCAPSTLGDIGAPIMIEVFGPQYGCNSGQIKAAQQWNAQMQQECKMQGYDKYDKKCMNF